MASKGRWLYDSDRKRPKTKEGKFAKKLPIVREYESVGMRLRGDAPQAVIDFFDILFAPLEQAAKGGGKL